MSGGQVRQLSIDWSDDSGNDQSIDIDCSVEETYTTAAELTEHAVEDGANISDNVRPHNDTFTFSCVISGTPIESPSFGMDGNSGSNQGQSITVGNQQITANTWTFAQPIQRVFACDQQIRALIKAGTTVTMTTGVRQIPNCVVLGHKWNRSAENGNDLVFTLDVSEVRIATTQSTTVSVPARRTGQTQGNAGSQPAQQDSRGVLARAADALGIGQ